MIDKKRNYAIEQLSSTEEDKLNFMLGSMKNNKAFLDAALNLEKKDDKDLLLQKHKDKYLNYRKNWRNFPKMAISKKLYGDDLKKIDAPPLCIDVELAAVCDLACPHCYRQTIATPDKIMKKELAFKIIDQASLLKVPSMKFNWRGEPLLNPQLPEIISYAKSKGILETIINTNATKLNDKVSNALIDAGLDLIIYSFDGGTKETYEFMRPGRFKKNSFEDVYYNIINFARIKNSRKSILPRTKIQMVLTHETINEVDSYLNLFQDVVDDVSVKQYTERGGKIKDFNDSQKNKINEFIKKNNISGNYELMRSLDGTLFISDGRLPCEQPYQRLLVTYDGRVSMCCYDWGSMHTIGYVDELAIKLGDKDYNDVKNKAENKTKGFEMMNLKMPFKFNEPEKIVSTLSEIWTGKEIDHIRKKQNENKVNEVKICKKCPFKETYSWKKIDL